MIDIILPENRFAFARALLEMHRDRKQFFVDRLGWALPSRESWLEVDEFDSEHAVYLVALEPETGRHQGSVRLLPSTRPHVLGSVFPSLCADQPPVGADCWEISRFLASPVERSGNALVRVHRLLALALVEFALLNDIRTYSLIVEFNRVPALLSIGWDVRPLGLPAFCGDEQLQALQIIIGDDALSLVQRKLGIKGPVLRLSAPLLRAA